MARNGATVTATFRVIGVVPARRGSKGVPRKNLRLLAGKPLVVYTLDAARESRLLDHVIVTTDDPDVAAVSRTLGVDVIDRPADLAGDDVPMWPVVNHALEHVERSAPPTDAVFTLQPTTPFRTADDIDAAIELLRIRDADSVIGVVRVYDTHPARMKRIEDGFLEDFCIPEDESARRQDLPPAYLRNGAIYVTRRDVVARGSLRGRRQLAFEMPPERSVNVDEPLDLVVAEALLRERGAPTS